MFGFDWSEFGLIAVVALILIGPKDLPVAIKAVSGMIRKARRMASEFQSHVDEMVRDANLDEVRSQINEIRNFDIKGEVERAVDADGTIRASFTDPMATINPDTPVAAHPTTEIAAPEPDPTPSFIPPGVKVMPEPVPAPPFIPPEVPRPWSLRH